MDKIKTWSFSRLMDFEQCAYRAKLKYIDKIPEPPRPLPPGKSEHPMDRGTRIHEAAELYVRGGVELAPELQGFSTRFDVLRDAFKQKQVIVEEEWAFDRDWAPVAWSAESAWVRMKLDVLHWQNALHAKVIDHKTGKRKGNEVKHTEQGQLYQLAAFLKYPALEYIEVEFWYLDHTPEHDLVGHYTRTEGTALFDKWHKRGEAMTDATEFEPNANTFTCKWCPYAGNACEHGMTAAKIEVSKGPRLKPSGIAALFSSKS